MVSLWTRIRARFNPLVQPRFYTAYKIGKKERVGQLNEPVDDIRQFLREQGYQPQRLSAAKAHPNSQKPFRGEDLHVISYRRVPDEHPPEWELSKWSPEQCQYHVHVFNYENVPELYSHYELRPHLIPIGNESFNTAYGRFSTHYKPDRGTEYLPGVTDLDVSSD